MNVLIVNYIKQSEEVKPHIDAHNIWVKKYFDEGIFMAAGPKKSKLGGVILAKTIDKSKLLKILAEDSYVQYDVAEYQIIEVDFKLTETGLEKLLNN